MNRPRLQLSPALRQRLDYPKFASDSIRMLILDANYYFERSWKLAAEALGWQSRQVHSVISGGLTRQDIQDLFMAVCEFQPDFVIASNFAGIDVNGVFQGFFEDARIPYVSWFTDTPRMILHERQIYMSPYVVAATWERAYIPYLHALQFQHVFYMPLATDPELFSTAPETQWKRPLAFVGNSMVALANDAWRTLEPYPALVRGMLAAFEEGRVNRTTFVAGIDSLLDAALLEGCTPSVLRHIELCFIYEATRRERATLAVALDDFGLEVRGDPDWRYCAGRAGDPISYTEALPAFYRETAVNVNVTSLQMSTAVNQRVFDCPAAGGFLITDAQSDLQEMFEPDEYVAYSSLDELRDLVRHYLAHPAERNAIVERARKRILAQHTHACRLRELAGWLREVFAG